MKYLRAYGSIPHLPGSKQGRTDKGCNEGQYRICCVKPRKGDRIIVSEKLDGSNTCVAKVNDTIVPLTRAGYHANSSPYRQHHEFAKWVTERYTFFNDLLNEGERLCGEWMLQAHGSLYTLTELWYVFDLYQGKTRLPYDEASERLMGLPRPTVLHDGSTPFSIEQALSALAPRGYHGCHEMPEGAVWRVERPEGVDFLAKYVRPDKIDGKLMKDEIWNQRYVEPHTQTEGHLDNSH